MGSIHVLLIEDDLVDARMIRRQLAQARVAQFELRQVSTLEEALVRLDVESFDAVLLDLTLPDSTGLDTLQRVTKRAPDVPVVVLTGAENPSLPSSALQAGAQDYLQKGDPSSVERAIRYAVDRRNAELERLEIQERLQEVQRLESLGLMAGAMAHDFNNILTAILAQASLCRADTAEGTAIDTALGHIERSAERAGDLCKQLLAYSGRGKFVVGPIDLSGLVAEMVEMLGLTIPAEVDFESDLPEGLPRAQGSDAQVRQVVMNLITNAADAIDGKGRIVARTGVLDCEEADFEDMIVGASPGRFVAVEVSDTGCGMTPETRERMFSPFFTTKATGHGLGLSAVLGIVRSHGAALDVESKVGSGTTVRVLFPVAEVSEEAAAEAAEPDARPDGRRTVLVVEDDEEIRLVTKLSLERSGMRVLLAEDGVSGLELFEAHANEISMVLLDLTMPRLGGEEVYRRLSSSNPELPVLLMSGYSDAESIVADRSAGPSGFLQKPFTVQQLMDSCRRALG